MSKSVPSPLTAETLTRMIAAGAKRVPADLVIKDVGLLDLVTGEITVTDIAIVAGRIVGTHATYEGKEVIDGRGRFAVPGFIDTHLHIESSLMTPLEFDRCVLPHGVTTVICDPHEIANVLGVEGIRYFLDGAERSIMDIRVNLSSCVPATPFETAGAALEIDDLLPLAGHKQVIGLAEMMNFPGVLNADPGILAKLLAFQDGHIDGHAPLLLGTDLNGYLAAGIHTDHESTSAAEAREKLKKGVAVLIRESSVCKDLPKLAEILDENSSSFVALCTDDRNPIDIEEEGHLDHSVRHLIALGRPLHHAYRAASHSAARIFGLRDRGLVAPGYRADIVLVDSLEDCSISDVFSAGRRVTPELFETRAPLPPVGLNSVKAKPVTAQSFRVAPNPGKNSTPVIGVKPGLVLTFRDSATLASGPDGLMPDLEADVIKVAVVERHGKNGNIATAFTRGFGLKTGAIASSVGHDSHNITVVGANGADMALAVNRLIEMQGGFVVAAHGGIRAELPMRVAGLMSELPFEEISKRLRQLRAEAKALGCTLPEPFLQVSFLALPVIPHLKMTDRGLFDVDAFDFVS